MKWPSEKVVDATERNGVKVTTKVVYAYFDKGGTRICTTRLGKCSYIIESADCGPEIYSEDGMIELVTSL